MVAVQDIANGKHSSISSHDATFPWLHFPDGIKCHCFSHIFPPAFFLDSSNSKLHYSLL